MLVNFTFKNFRSFRDEMTLSMEAASIQELAGSVVPAADENLLPVAVMYGANSSGKSNVLKALRAMRDVLLNSVKLNPKDKLDAEPFCLNMTSGDEPTSLKFSLLSVNPSIATVSTTTPKQFSTNGSMRSEKESVNLNCSSVVATSSRFQRPVSARASANRIPLRPIDCSYLSWPSSTARCHRQSSTGSPIWTTCRGWMAKNMLARH